MQGQDALFSLITKMSLGFHGYCKTLIIRVTLFSWGYQPRFIHKTLFLRFFIYSSIILTLEIIGEDFIFASVHSRIYAKIKSSPIKSVLQYIPALYAYFVDNLLSCGTQNAWNHDVVFHSGSSHSVIFCNWCVFQGLDIIDPGNSKERRIGG